MSDLSLLHRFFRLSKSRLDHPMIEVWGQEGDRVFRAQSISYKEAGEIVLRKASALQKELTPSDTLVGIHLPPGPSYVTTDLALMLIGRTPVLIDHLLPPESVRGILEAFGITALVTWDETLKHFLKSSGPYRTLSSEEEDRKSPPQDPGPLLAAALPQGSETVAHLLLTSGTTGEPKGVPLSHRNLLSDADAALTYGVFTDRDRVLSVLPLHHSYPYMTGILLPLSCGGTILFPPDLSPAALAGVLQQGEVTIFPAIPLLWERFHRRIFEEIGKKSSLAQTVITRGLLPWSYFLRRRFGLTIGAIPFRAVRRRFGPRMKALFSGGAALPPEIARDFLAMGLTMLEGYGLTETSPVVSVNTPSNWSVGTVGPPIPGVEVRVLPPEEGRPGGRILVRGPIVADFWWFPGGERRPIKDAEGWFDTGDLGFLSEGRLTLVGREKEVIVLPSGKNIFPEFLEQTLIKKGHMAEAAVFLEGKALIALVRSEDPSVGDAQIREVVEAVNWEHPGHSRIAAFEIVNTPLPRTRLGKLRRFKLPDIYREIRSRRMGSHKKSLIPDSPLVGRVRDLIRSISGIGGEIPDDAKLEADLGIDSLGKIELLQEIEEILGQEVPDTLLTGIVTVGDLLERMSKEGASGAPPADPLTPPLNEAEESLIPGKGPGPHRELALPQRFLYQALRHLAGWLWGVAWPHVSASGSGVPGEISLPPGPFVVVSNFSGPLDPLLLALSLPKEILARTFMGGGPSGEKARLRPFQELVRLIPGEDGQGVTELRMAIHLLRSGSGLVVFPEGEATPDGRLGVFGPGIGSIVRRVKCPILPARISGSYKAWPPHRRFPRLGPVSLHFGPMIPPEAFQGLDEGAIARVLEGAVRKIPDSF